MKAFFNDMNTKGSIEPKDAFFGGRTICQKLFAEASREKEISYMDIISLYPSVNFNVKYPVGMPTIIRPENHEVEWNKAEDIVHDGLYKVRILPPKDLYLPVLPERVNQDDPRLLFTLCMKCSVLKSTPSKCPHTDDQRGWTR
jgi:hypothetical protein